MFDEEAVRAVGKRAHQLELVGGEPEPLDIVGGARLGVRHEDLRCRLFDDRAGDPASEGVLCALGRKADNTAQLADRLLPILDPADEDIVIERSEEHTSELQSLMRISYAVFCLKKKKKSTKH